jgi:hypothetical protein
LRNQGEAVLVPELSGVSKKLGLKGLLDYARVFHQQTVDDLNDALATVYASSRATGAGGATGFEHVVAECLREWHGGNYGTGFIKAQKTGETGKQQDIKGISRKNVKAMS